MPLVFGLFLCVSVAGGRYPVSGMYRPNIG